MQKNYLHHPNYPHFRVVVHTLVQLQVVYFLQILLLERCYIETSQSQHGRHIREHASENKVKEIKYETFLN